MDTKPLILHLSAVTAHRVTVNPPQAPPSAGLCRERRNPVALEALDLELFRAAACFESRKAAEEAVRRFKASQQASIRELETCPTLKVKLVKPRFDDPAAHTLEVLVPRLDAKEPQATFTYRGQDGKTRTLKRPTFGYFVRGKAIRLGKELVYTTPRRLDFAAMDDAEAEAATIRALLTRSGSDPSHPDQGIEVGPVESWTVICVVGGIRQELIFKGSIEALRRHLPDAITRARWEQAGVTQDELNNMGVPLRIFKNR